MPSFVRISFFPIKKDASPETIAQTLGAVGGKEKFLSSPGLLKAYYSTGLDPNEPPAIELVDVWSSLDALTAYKNSPDAATLRTAFQTSGLIDSSNPQLQPYANIFTFDEDFVALVAASPVLQSTIILLGPDTPAADFEAKWAAAMQGWTPPAGWKGRVRGWATELSEHPGLGKAQVFLAMVGWESEAAAAALGDSLKERFAHMQGDALYHQVRMTTLKEVN